MPATPADTTPNGLADLPDQALAARARGGSQAAFGEIVRRYESRLYSFVLRRVDDAAEAEDITQEAFLRGWRRIDRYRPEWRFSTWLFTIAGRVAITHLRRRRVRELATGCLAPRGAASRPDQAVEIREQCARVWETADRVLGAHQRSALWLRYAEDLSVRDIARILGRTRVGTRVLLFRARETLAEHLAGADDIATSQSRPRTAMVERQMVGHA